MAHTKGITWISRIKKQTEGIARIPFSTRPDTHGAGLGGDWLFPPNRFE